MTGKKKWCTEEVFSLIAQWESHPELWDTNSLDYQSKSNRQNSYKELAALFNTDTYEIQRKLHNLRTQYSDELRKIAKRRSENNTCTPSARWRFFNAMNFIRNSTSNLSSFSSSILDANNYERDKNDCTLEISEIRSEAKEEYVLPDLQQNSAESETHEGQVESTYLLVEKTDSNGEDFENEFAESIEVMSENEGREQTISEQYVQMIVPATETHTEQSELDEIETEGRWPDEKTLQLIELYKEAEFLWNKSHREYKNLRRKESTMKEIAMKLGLKVRVVNRKIINLRNQYGGERRKLLKKLKERSKDKKSKINSCWKFYKALNFLGFVGDERENNIVSSESVNEEQIVDCRSSMNEDHNSADSSMTISDSIQRTEKFNSRNLQNRGHSFENRVVDEYQIFADFLAHELRKYPEKYAAKLKLKLLKSVVEVSEEYLQDGEQNQENV